MTSNRRSTRTALDHRCYRRSAYLLAEMIAAVSLILVAAALATAGVHTALRAHLRSAEITVGYHSINSLLNALRNDTRSAVAAAALPTADGTCAFEIETPDGKVRYSFSGDRVTRQATGSADRASVPKQWHIKQATITAEFDSRQGSDRTKQRFSLLTVRIRWRGQSKKDVDPTRRFDATFSIGRGYQP